jgi:hypothetical protein
MVTDMYTQFCPNCGQTMALPAAQPPATPPEQPPTYDTSPSGAQQSYPSNPMNPMAPPPYGVPAAPSQPFYGQPPYGQPPYGQPPYGQPPYGQPPYGQPPYGAPAAPSQPFYGQPPAPPTQPVYGQPVYGQPPVGQPQYGTGYGAPGGYPGAYRPGMDWKPTSGPSRPPFGRIIAGVVAVLVLIAVGVSVYYQTHAQPTPPLTTAQVSASATAAANSSNTLLADSLMNNTNGWDQDGTHCYFAQDGYHIRDGYLCYAPIGVQTDGTESVTAKEVSGPTDHGYGLVFRRASKGNYYMFVIYSNSEWAVFKIVNDTLFKLQDYTPNSIIKGGLNTENSLSVTMTGSTFDCYINGAKVGTVHDSTFTHGLWGLGVYSTDNVVFTNYLARR